MAFDLKKALGAWTPEQGQKTASDNIKQALQALTDVGYRGFVGGLAGAPVDMGTGLLNALGMAGSVAGHEAGLLPADKLYKPIEKPVGGSEWIGQALQNAGVVSPTRRPVGELLAGLVSPDPTDLMHLAAIPALTKLQDAATAAKLDPSQITVKDGVIHYPDEWINTLLGDIRGDVASHNAEKMLGLSPDATRLERKAAQYPVDVYRGSPVVESAPRYSKGSEFGVFAVDNPHIASDYATSVLRSPAGVKVAPNVMPLAVNLESPYIRDFAGKSKQGNELSQMLAQVDDDIGGLKHDAIIAKNLSDSPRGDEDYLAADIYSMLKPKNIRSQFAQFDPAKKDSSNLLASLLAGTVVGKMATSENKKKKDKKL